MDPDKIIQLLFQMLGQNSNMTPGAPLGTQLTETALSFMMPEGPGREMLSQSLGPEVNKMMFGTGPFAGFGGIGSQWNYASRMTQYNQEQLIQRYKDNLKQNIQAQNQEQYIQMQANRGISKENALAGMKTDPRYWAMRVANAITMPEQVGIGVRDSSTAFGYTFGAGFDESGTSGFRERNALIEERMLGKMTYDPATGRYKSEEGSGTKPLAQALTEDFMNKGYLFGNLGGKDVGDLTKEMARTGGLKDLKDLKAPWNDEKLGNVKEEIQKTSRAISGIKDIIKGSIPEMIKQMEAAFGGESINTFGIEKVARGVQTYRQLAETTGTSLTDAIQYSRAAAGIGKAVAGYDQAGMATGLSIQAIMASPAGDMRGLNNAEFARTAVERTSGARLSNTAMMVSGAINMMRRQGRSEDEITKFKNSMLSSGEPVTDASIAKAVSDITGGTVTAANIINESRTLGARDVNSDIKETTGETVALMNSEKQWRRQRIGVLQRLGADAETTSKLAGMSMRDIEAFVGDKNNKISDANLGNVRQDLENIGQNFGFSQGDTEAVEYFKRQTNARELSKLAIVKEKWATNFGFGGGGLSGILREWGAGKIGSTGIGDLTSKFFGMASKEGIGGKNFELLKTAMGGETTPLMEAMKSAMASVKTDDPLYDKKMSIISKEIENLMQDAATNSITPEKYAERIKILSDKGESGYLSKKLKDYDKTVEGQLSQMAVIADDTAPGGFKKKTGGWDSFNYEERRKAYVEFTKKKAEEVLNLKELSGQETEELKKLNDKKDSELSDKEKLKKGELAQRQSAQSGDVRRKLDLIRKGELDEEGLNKATKELSGVMAGPNDETGVKILESGVNKGILDYVKELTQSVKSIAKIAEAFGGGGAKGNQEFSLIKFLSGIGK